MADTKDINKEWNSFNTEYTNEEYPIGVYYLDLPQTIMGSIRLHWHPEIELDFVKTGSAVYNLGEESIQVDAGSAIVINEGRIHSIENKNPGSECVIISMLVNIEFLFNKDGGLLSAKYKEPITSNQSLRYALFTPDNKRGRDGIDCINALLKSNLDKKYGYELETKSLLCNLWMQLLNISALERNNKISVLSILDEERVKYAISYINKMYSKPLTLDEISESVHLSKSECCRCFKRATNMTPFEYLMRQRILESARKMQRNDPIANSISELAESVGFNNASYYNRIFKKYFGDTPTKCKEQLKKSHRDSLSPFGISLARI